MSATGPRNLTSRLAAMPWRRTNAAALGAVVALALAVAGCGSGDEKSIPPSSSEQLLAALEVVREQVRAGRCELAESEAVTFQSTVEEVSGQVDGETRDELNQLADNLVELAGAPGQCTTEEGATGEAGVVETEPTTTETTEPTTTETTTEEEPDKPEPAQPEPSEAEQQGGSESQGGGPEGGGDVGGIVDGGGSSGGVKPRHGGGRR
jgi:uncharacterized membrane protein YgcG